LREKERIKREKIFSFSFKPRLLLLTLTNLLITIRHFVKACIPQQYPFNWLSILVLPRDNLSERIVRETDCKINLHKKKRKDNKASLTSPYCLFLFSILLMHAQKRAI